MDKFFEALITAPSTGKQVSEKIISILFNPLAIAKGWNKFDDVSLPNIRRSTIIGMMITVCTFHLLAAELIPTKSSKGDILRFKHGTTGSRKAASDSEAVPPVTSAQDSGESSNKKDISPVGDDAQNKDNGTALDKSQEQSSVFH